jgi:hypothetical protein
LEIKSNTLIKKLKKFNLKTKNMNYRKHRFWRAYKKKCPREIPEALRRAYDPKKSKLSGYAKGFGHGRSNLSR